MLALARFNRYGGYDRIIHYLRRMGIITHRLRYYCNIGNMSMTLMFIGIY